MSTWIVEMPSGSGSWASVCDNCGLSDESTKSGAAKIAVEHAAKWNHGPVDPACVSLANAPTAGQVATWVDHVVGHKGPAYNARCSVCGLLGTFAAKADALSEAAGHRCTTAPYSAQLRPDDKCTCGHPRLMHYGSPFCRRDCPCNGFSAATDSCTCGHEQSVHLDGQGPDGTCCVVKGCKCKAFSWCTAKPVSQPNSGKVSQPKSTEDCWSCRGRRACDVCGRMQ